MLVRPAGGASRESQFDPLPSLAARRMPAMRHSSVDHTRLPMRSPLDEVPRLRDAALMRGAWTERVELGAVVVCYAARIDHVHENRAAFDLVSSDASARSSTRASVRRAADALDML
ncbi:aldo/keto reductase [Burkholderia sp. MSMB1552]|nr:aldo/keto reductase [Burkholderia thailandensis]KST75211.1 aldo/keto reductase [Burkholderia humptydooensis]KVN10993.1 aldo/keto reductase [Burkholderia sp. MSMB1552]KWZ55059.1 aldo/keto reductase [Burkholderia sp. MSMB1588]